jgi:AcrR family transcriptional regulator
LKKGGEYMSEKTKDTIVQAAVSLFNTKGYDGTSMRDIARRAKVNISQISYYFENKHGLLEYCLTTFFEAYLYEMEKGFSLLNKGAVNCLKQILENILKFESENIPLTRLVLREMSIDSQLVREIMSTYFVKERYYFKKVFEDGMKMKEFKSFSVNYMIVQFKGFLSMPFLNSYYLSEVLHIFPHESYFTEKYLKEIYKFIDEILCNNNDVQPQTITALPSLVVIK